MSNQRFPFSGLVVDWRVALDRVASRLIANRLIDWPRHSESIGHDLLGWRIGRLSGSMLVGLLQGSLVLSTITATPAKAESASPDQLTVIRQRGVVRIGVSPDLPGISIRSNNPAGFKGAEASLALLVGKALLGHPTGVQLVGVDSPERLVKLQAGAIDLAIGQITITPQRQRLVDFSIPYVTAYEALLLPATSTISSLNQLNGQSVSVADGSASQPRYKKQWPLIRLVATPGVSGGLELLRRGAVVAWAYVISSRAGGEEGHLNKNQQSEMVQV